jgi:hypothetical protein
MTGFGADRAPKSSLNPRENTSFSSNALLPANITTAYTETPHYYGDVHVQESSHAVR